MGNGGQKAACDDHYYPIDVDIHEVLLLYVNRGIIAIINRGILLCFTGRMCNVHKMSRIYDVNHRASVSPPLVTWKKV